MAGTFISALPSAPSAQLTDEFPVDQYPGPVTYKETNSQILSLFKNNGEALTSVDDTNVTMTLGGSPSIALLNATSMTLGWTGTLSPIRGGTGINNGASTLTLGGSLTTLGSFTSTFTMTGNTNVTFPTSGTLSTTMGTVTSVSGTPNRITSTGGNTPVIDIAATYVGQSSITTLGTIATGVWAGTVIGAQYGGTGQSTYATGDILYSSAANTLSKLPGNITTTKQYLSQTGDGALSAAPVWSTVDGTDITGAALTKADDTNVTLALGGTPTTALLRATSITAGWTGQLSLARGGTNANLTASNGGIVYSDASAMAILSGTATAGQIIRSGANAAPSWSTSTYPATNAVSTLLYASSANVMGALATANNGILVTSSGGVPSIGNTVGAGLTMPSITFNSTTGIVGTTTNDNAASGSVGEVISSSVSSGSAVALTTGVTVNITSISLTAGQWEVWGAVGLTGTAGAVISSNIASVSTTSATVVSANTLAGGTSATGSTFNWIVGTNRLPTLSINPAVLQLSATTTVYLVTNCEFTTQPVSGFGKIVGVRRR